MHNASELSWRLIALAAVLLAIGIGLLLPLYKFNIRSLMHSRVFVKALFWIPILFVFLGILNAGPLLRGLFFAVVLGGALLEICRAAKGRETKLPYYFYGFFAVGLVHFYLIGWLGRGNFDALFVAVCLGAVLSDVAAYFFGSYWGSHKLPALLNAQKSWEGVLGQLAGAAIGITVVKVCIASSISLWLFVPVGLGSILGDLSNSYVKRRLRIKDWGTTIPGHGGLLDRLCSLAGAAMLAFYYLLATGQS